MASNYNCEFCFSKYHTKYYLDRHMVFCKLMHSSHMEQKQREDSIDMKLTETQKNRILRDLLFEVQKIKKELTHCKLEISHLKHKKKVSLVKWLNSDSGPVPKCTLKEWIMEIPIMNSHLEKVFQHDLVDGIIAAIKDAILVYGTDLPWAAFIEKPKTMFGYRKTTAMIDSTEYTSENSKWEMIDTEEMKKIWRILAHRFLQIFLCWQNENMEMIQSSEEWREKHMLYLQKIMGENCENSRHRRIHEWLYSKISKSCIEFEFI